MKPYFEDTAAGITIYHGDCRDLLQGYMDLIDLSAVDVVLTDPPYGIGWSQHGGGHTGKTAGMRRLPPIIGDEDVSLRDGVLAFLSEKPALVFGSFRAPFPPNVVQVLVYQKTPDAGLVGSTTGFRRDAEPIFLLGPWPLRPCRASSVVASTIGLQTLAKPGYHPHSKPLDVLRNLLTAMPEGVVLDPFMGGGSTLVAAKDLGRRAIGIEIEERHCATAAERLSQGVLELGA